MLTLRLDESKGAGPLHEQIAHQILFQIKDGGIESGVFLPPSRDLARQLGVARGTVVRAYEDLCNSGACESRVGSGTMVKKQATLGKSKENKKRTHSQDKRLAVPDEPFNIDPREISLLPSIADTEHLPISQLRRGFDRVLRYPAHLRSFGESAGDPMLRRLICEKILPRRGISAEPNEVLIVPGTQYGSVLIALTLLSSRRNLHLGCPGYMDIARNFERFGYRIKLHSVDANGIDLCDSKLGSGDILHVMPEHHFPQCVTLSDLRRAAIMQQIRERDLLVIEDDYDSEFYYDHQPKPAMKSGETNENIIYLGTFSKTLFNGLRLGYIVAAPALVRELASLHWSLSRGTSIVLQRWVAELIKDDTIEQHIQRMRTVYRRKRDRIARILSRDFPQWSFAKPKGGLQFFVEVDSPEVARSVMSACASGGLKIASPSNYVMDNHVPQRFLVFGFGSAALSQMEAALSDVKLALSGAG